MSKKIMAAVTLTDEKEAIYAIQFKTEGGKLAAIENPEAMVMSGDIQADVSVDPNWTPGDAPAQEGAQGFLLRVKGGSPNTQGSALFRFDGNTNPEVADFLEVEILVATTPATAQGIELADPTIQLKS